MTSHLPPRWAERLCLLLGTPPSSENLRFLHAWARAEGGNAQWNPLNATYTLPYGESWPLAGNTSGVQNYFKPVAGIAATALELIQTVPDAHFNLINADMQAAYTSEQIVERRRKEIQTWGTNPDAILAVLKEM